MLLGAGSRQFIAGDEADRIHTAIFGGTFEGILYSYPAALIFDGRAARGRKYLISDPNILGDLGWLAG